MRDVVDKSAAMHRGEWNKSATGSRELRGKTLGIVGYGAIGSQLSVLAEALGMRVVFYDVVERLALGNARRLRSLDALLAEARRGQPARGRAPDEHQPDGRRSSSRA